MTILQSTLSQDIAKLQAENDALRAKLAAAKDRKLTIKASEKGAVSVYGLGRFPVTLYRRQFERLLDHADAIREFIADNADLLATRE